ncbi:MAG: hypothetical protein GY846_14955 [Deltaproteobacteria bacterium]|nr:hypothetical protein [Deltaproteobacteria bacterium]
MYTVFIPLITLILLFFLGLYLSGSSGPKWPVTVEKVTTAFGSNACPLVLVLSGLIASCVAILLFPRQKTGYLLQGVLAFSEGARSLFGFLPAGLGLPPLLLLPMGALFLMFLPTVLRWFSF